MVLSRIDKLYVFQWELIVHPWLRIYSCFVMMSLSADKQADIIHTFNTTSRYLIDILDLHLSVSYDIVSTKFYDRRDDF